MVASARFAGLLFIAALGAEADSGIAATKGVVAAAAPKQELSPPVESDDDHFFGKDYPHDKQPRVPNGLKFPSPYPEIQEADAFDEDYPKDENDDSGEWKAQMDYDTARSSLRKRQDDTVLAKHDKEVAEQELEHAREDAARADEEVAKADRGVQDAERDVRDAEHEADAADTHAGEVAQTVDEAMKEVEAKVKNLEGCEEQLAQAKAALEKILQARKIEERIRVKKALQAKEALRKAEAEMKAMEEGKAKLEERKKNLAERGEKLLQAQQNATTVYEQAAAEESQAEDALKSTGNGLRRFRNVPGGEEEKHVAQSGASHSPGLLAVLVGAVLAPAVGSALL